MNKIVRGSRISLQDQILRALVKDIEDEKLRPGDRLPTERQLAELTGASLAPVRAALKQLEQAGYVTRTQGRGTFIADRPVQYELRLMSSSTESLRRAGVAFTVDVVDQSIGNPPPAAAERLDLDPQTSAFHLLRVVTVRDAPSILLESWVGEAFMGDLVNDDIFDRGGSLYSALKKNGVEQRRAAGQVSIHNLLEWEADLLGMSFGAPLLVLTSVTYDADGAAIDWSRGLYDSARFSLEMDTSINV
jgi:GntR family transcriptional regulator